MAPYFNPRVTVKKVREFESVFSASGTSCGDEIYSNVGEGKKAKKSGGIRVSGSHL